jgi:hypothetical protein
MNYIQQQNMPIQVMDNPSAAKTGVAFQVTEQNLFPKASPLFETFLLSGETMTSPFSAIDSSTAAESLAEIDHSFLGDPALVSVSNVSIVPYVA